MSIDTDNTRLIGATKVEALCTAVNVIPYVLAQHADSAAALAQDIYYAFDSTNYTPSDLEELESRLDANIDGLYISADEGWPHYKKHLSADEYGEVFTNAVIAIKLKNSERFEQTFETAADNEELLNAVADAFIWLPFQEIASYLDMLYQTRKPEKQFVAITAYAGHRTIVDEHLLDALQSKNPMLYRRAIIAVAELGRKSLLALVKSAMQHEDESIKFSACWALTRFGDASAMEALKTFLTHPHYGEQALQLVAMQKDTLNTTQLLRSLYQNSSTRRLSIYGTGLLGTPKAIDPLIKVMEDEELARVAGEAFSFITGVDLEYENLDQDAPEGFEGGPTEDPEDENVDMDPDEDLPWPNSALIAKWWQQNQSRFLPTRKYIMGKEISMAQYKQVLIHGTQKQRGFAALAIAVHQQDQPIFNVKAPAKRQKQLLGI